MLSLVAPEQRVPKAHPLRRIKELADAALQALSPTFDARVEEIFGWAKTVACFRKTRFRGRARTQLAAHFVAAAYNLLRISKLLPA
jgi:hypothetical protein